MDIVIDERNVEKTPDYIRPPWYTDDRKNMNYSLCKMKKGTPNELFYAKFQELVIEIYNNHTRVYTDGSKKESTRRKIRDQSSIFSAKQEAIIGAIQKLPTTGVREVIFTDSLSTMMVASGNNHTKNPKARKIRQLMDKRKGNVTLCWVPRHFGITGNDEAELALEESIPDDEKYPKED
jgi:ribonuclease HI